MRSGPLSRVTLLVAIVVGSTACASGTGSDAQDLTRPSTTLPLLTTTSSPPRATTTTQPTTTTSIERPSTTRTLPRSLAPTEATVVSVSDGDTIVVALEGSEATVRLIGIDAAEDGECMASEASARLEALVAGRTVTLLSDVSNRDRYGRLLRYVYVDDIMINELLVREGLALARGREPDTAMETRLQEAQSAAWAEDLGMWAPDACGS